MTKYFLSVNRVGVSEGWRKKDVTKHTADLEAGPALYEPPPGKGFALAELLF